MSSTGWSTARATGGESTTGSRRKHIRPNRRFIGQELRQEVILIQTRGTGAASHVATISDSQIDLILEISGRAAECVDEPCFPPELFQQMIDLFGSKSCVFYSMGEDLDHDPIWDGFGYNLDLAPIEQYEAHYRQFDPCFAGLRRRAHQRQSLVVSTDQVIAAQRSYTGSGYYRDFLRPQRIHNSIIFAVGDQEGLLGLFGFHRALEKPIYGSREHLKARLFASQFAGALRLRKLQGEQERLRALVKKLIQRGWISDYLVIDKDWRPVDVAGTFARKLFGNSGETRIIGERDQSAATGIPRQIRAHLDGPESHEHRMFDNIPGWPRVLVDRLEFEGIQPLYLLAFVDRNRKLVSEAKIAHFGITPRERQVVHEVSRGLTTTQIAARLGISEKTVEHHLGHLYRKTGTHNRTALVYRLST